jgi:hypothetical protein
MVWKKDCDWGCSPNDDEQPSGVILNFGDFWHELLKQDSADIDIKFEKEMPRRWWTLTFFFSDGSNKTATLDMSSWGRAFDDFEQKKWKGGQGWLDEWYHVGDVKIDKKGYPHEGKNHLLFKKGSGYVKRATDVSDSTNLYATFWAKASGWNGGDEAQFQISHNNADWVTMRTWTLADSDNRYHFYNISLANQTMSSEFWIAFKGDMSEKEEYFYVDYIRLVDDSS